MEVVWLVYSSFIPVRTLAYGRKYLGLFTGHDPARGSGPTVLKNTRVESPWIGRCSKSDGSDRVRSGQEGFKYHGSGRFTLTRSDPREVTQPMKSPENIDDHFELVKDTNTGPI